MPIVVPAGFFVVLALYILVQSDADSGAHSEGTASVLGLNAQNEGSGFWVLGFGCWGMEGRGMGISQGRMAWWLRVGVPVGCLAATPSVRPVAS